ncbi:hypothetical protein C8J57DRAFT_1240946 [Mycena rebaudengoi]|nr:hypothetical protein C8J57DRAFT_1240946 [Mycena rebaudengoi]
MTREAVEKYLQDVWIMWMMAQRFSVPLKVKVSIEKGMDCGYPESYFTSPPNLILPKIIGALWEGLFLLLEIICFVIVSPRFIKTLLHAGTSRMQIRWIQLLDPSARNELGSFYQGMQEDGGHKNLSNVQQVLIAYTVDLVTVLQQLFDITLQFKLIGYWVLEGTSRRV